MIVSPLSVVLTGFHLSENQASRVIVVASAGIAIILYGLAKSLLIRLGTVARDPLLLDVLLPISAIVCAILPWAPALFPSRKSYSTLSSRLTRRKCDDGKNLDRL